MPCAHRPTLSSVFESDDLVYALTQRNNPAVAAALCACSKGLRNAFGKNDLWRELVALRFGVEAARGFTGDARREFARLTIISALSSNWAVTPANVSSEPLPSENRAVTSAAGPSSSSASSSSTCPSGNHVRPSATPSPAPTETIHPRTRLLFSPATPAALLWSPDTATATPAPPLLASSSSSSSSTSYSSGASSSSSHRQPLGSLATHQAMALPQLSRSPSSSSTSSSSSHTSQSSSVASLNPCTISRLQKSLQKIVMGGAGKHIQAFPEKEDSWSVWRATITCPPDGASRTSGLAHTLRLTFRDDELPHAQILSPLPCFHPNVDPRGQAVCAKALERRCTPVDLVSEQLKAVLSLLDRPVFDVAPLNAEAAALWYGNERVLRRRIRGEAAAEEEEEEEEEEENDGSGADEQDESVMMMISPPPRAAGGGGIQAVESLESAVNRIVRLS